MIILNLISGPRNISTAMMYSFAQRPDTAVLDEPFYALYLSRSGATHPGRDEVLRSQSASEQDVKGMIAEKKQSPVLFIKNMAHHMEVMNDPIIAGAKNIFLIRDPQQIIASYARVIEQPTLRDIGIGYQHTLFQQLERADEIPIVIDSGFILQDPESMLRQLCQRCGIAFYTQMLRWTAGPKPYDGVWAPYWYGNVHHSQGFETQKNVIPVLPAHLEALRQQAMRYYEKLLPFSIKP